MALSVHTYAEASEAHTCAGCATGSAKTLSSDPQKEALAALSNDQLRGMGVSARRNSMEIHHLGLNVTSTSALRLCLEMVEPHQDEPQVWEFMRMARKNASRERGRMKMRRLVGTAWDDDAPIILEALALADRLIDQHPDDAARLSDCRERLREFPGPPVARGPGRSPRN